MQAPKLVANIVIVNALGQLLLVRRSKTAPVRVFDWELPGGIVEPAEDPKATAIRELQEETGLSIKNANYLFAGTEPNKGTTGIFFYSNTQSSDIALSYEHDAFKWLEINDAIELVTVPGYKLALEFYKKYITAGYSVKVSTKCLVNSANQSLLLKRSETDKLGPGKWDLPGGGLEQNETIVDSMQRELLEETKLKVNNLQLVFAHPQVIKKNKEIRIRLGFLADSISNSVTLSHEHSEYKWVPMGQAYDFAKHDNWPGWGEFVKLFG